MVIAKKRKRNSSASSRRSTSTRQATAGRKEKNSDEMIANSRHQREGDIHLEMMMRRGKFIHKLLERNTDMNALLMGAQIKLRKEECALGMGQRSNDAALKDVQIKPIVADYVGGTVQSAIHTMNPLHLDQNSTRLLQL